MSAKKAVTLHGTDGDPSHGWQPWMREQLVANGYKVLHPLLPDNHTPNKQIYNTFLFGREWDFTDNVMVGHSSGATAILNLLSDERCPRIKAAVLVASFFEVGHEIPRTEWYDPGQFDGLFPAEGFDWSLLKQKCDKFYFVHGSNDPYCPIELAQKVADILEAKVLVIEDGHHLGGSSGFSELPGLMDLLHEEGVL